MLSEEGTLNISKQWIVVTQQENSLGEPENLVNSFNLSLEMKNNNSSCICSSFGLERIDHPETHRASEKTILSIFQDCENHVQAFADTNKGAFLR